VDVFVLMSMLLKGCTALKDSSEDNFATLTCWQEQLLMCRNSCLCVGTTCHIAVRFLLVKPASDCQHCINRLVDMYTSYKTFHFLLALQRLLKEIYDIHNDMVFCD
jgi:hypothetical protein